MSILSSFLMWIILFRRGQFCIVMGFESFGDNLLINSLIKQGFSRHKRMHVVASTHPKIYQHTPGVLCVISPRLRLYSLAKRLGVKVYEPVYEKGPIDTERHMPPRGNIMDELATAMELPLPVVREPLWTFPFFREARIGSAPRVAIISGGSNAKFPMLNKEWGSENFQQCVDLLKGEMEFLQLGDRMDLPLHGTVDGRGLDIYCELPKTLAACDLFVGQIGFLMHLAKALGVRSVIVYGGREQAWQSGYPVNVNLESRVECAPCWQYNICGHERKCLKMITPAAVAAEVRRALKIADCV